MKAKIVCWILAFVMGSTMLLACMATRSEAATFEYWYFEILASGKGVEADTDSNPPPNPVYSESKDSFSKLLLYARYERGARELTFAYYNEATAHWVSSAAIQAYETDNSVLAQTYPTYYPIYVDSDSSNLHVQGAIQIQYKAKNGVVTNAKLKSIGMSYYQTFDHIPAGDTKLIGELKLKGKQIGAADVPVEVISVF